MKDKSKCIREISTFSCIKPEYKFDGKNFNKKTLREQLPIISPKFIALLNKIKELDDKDIEKYGKKFKHIIYCDLDGVHGIKMISSGFIANGYKLIFDKNMNIKTGEESFAVLTSSTIYGNPMKVSTKKEIIRRFNERPSNIHGNEIRFLLLDVGFKEGIDVYDVKYLHMFEPSKTRGDEKQIIGRGTRFCGQKGLPYMKGWKLHVYKYDMENEKGKSIHELFMETTGIDMSKLRLENELIELFKYSAIDKELTKSIHNTEEKIIKEKDIIAKVIFGKVFYSDDNLDCKLGCFGPLKDFPKELLYIGVLLSDIVEIKNKLSEKNPKPYICHKVQSEKKLCRIYNKIWKNEKKFLKVNREDIIIALNKNRKILRTEIYNMIQSYIFLNIEKPNPIPPKTKETFINLQRYVKNNYKDYKWSNIKDENGCITKEETNKEKIVKFTPTQDFIRKFFTPSNPYKGILLNHSVGTGKTCSGIAIATNSFQKQGYTILWVTRTTLKGEMMKNMFDQVCSVIIQENIEAGIEIPKDIKERKKLMGNNWIPDVSYKQFANMLNGKNDLYKKMKERNGETDILHKTLIIIDEVHKLYSGDLKPQERPDTNILSEMIQHSYNVSGKDSVRLVLMTATPITTDLIGGIKIMNLLDEEQLPEKYEKFKEIYCNEDGTLKNRTEMIERFNGKISYLNREKDKTQFAIPKFYDTIKVPISRKIVDNLEKLEEELKTTKDKKRIRKEIKEMKEIIKNDCSVENKIKEC